MQIHVDNNGNRLLLPLGLSLGGGGCGVIDAGSAFRWRLVDGWNSWNNVNSFPPTTDVSIGKISFGYFPLKNKLSLSCVGGLNNTNVGDSFHIRIIDNATKQVLIQTTGSTLFAQALGGNAQVYKEIDTSAHAGTVAFLEFEALAAYTGNLTFVGIRDHFIIY